MKNMTVRLLAALCAIVVMLSLSVVVFADEPVETEGTVETAADTAEAGDKAEDTAEASGDDTAAADDHDHEEEEEKKDNSLLWSGIITLGIIVIIVICVLVWYFKDKEKAQKTWRSFKSEFKKVVWAEKHETLKKTIIVIIACVLIAAILGLVDYLFSLGVVGLGKLI